MHPPSERAFLMTENHEQQVARYADVAMYRAKQNPLAAQGEMVVPQVSLVYMTSKPLQVMAAAAELYAGNIVTDPSEVDRGTAERWFRDMTKTALQAPLEFIDLHFFFEGVTRAFTHQVVRQRTAVFVQESQRFAIKENAAREVAYPPSIAKLNHDSPMRLVWERAVAQNSWAYNALINGGIPAEDARGLLETNITTRMHYKTNLRNLIEHSGLRLCSQAQYEWKKVWAGIISAIYRYGSDGDRWQQQAIIGMFKPVCYRTGKCEFMAATDRYCAIRERVMSHHSKGEDSSSWQDINPHEAISEGAARMAPANENRNRVM